MADVVSRLDVVRADGSFHSFAAGELEWSYRRLGLEEKAGSDAVIVSLVVELRPADRTALERRSGELRRDKRARQPVGARNAGCVFRNPDPDHAAGFLIDRAGCKGRRVGDAQISEIHGNFLINRGEATCADVDELIETVRSSVRARFGVLLEEEIRRW